jgi:hypothetical protein
VLGGGEGRRVGWEWLRFPGMEVNNITNITNTNITA